MIGEVRPGEWGGEEAGRDWQEGTGCSVWDLLVKGRQNQQEGKK